MLLGLDSSNFNLSFLLKCVVLEIKYVEIVEYVISAVSSMQTEE